MKTKTEHRLSNNFQIDISIDKDLQNIKFSISKEEIMLYMLNIMFFISDFIAFVLHFFNYLRLE